MGEMMELAEGLLVAGAILVLAWTIERRGRRDEARAVETSGAAEREALRLCLLERRLAGHSRFDALWLCWSRRVRPEAALLSEAAAAAEEAKLLFADEHRDDLDEACRLIAALEQARLWQEEALRGGLPSERDALRERQAEIETALAARVQRLRERLGAETRSSALAA